ncbi:metal ABC transporter permease, partial [Salmonella enterica]|uniref:metal ABC transporter permease n=1 Tax=Salmonella enterica TaxID=28901 RepID=UPI00398C5545
MTWLVEPFGYQYMLAAMWVSAMVGGLCASLSCYSILKGWSLTGYPSPHSIVPVAGGTLFLLLPCSAAPSLSLAPAVSR